VLLVLSVITRKETKLNCSGDLTSPGFQTYWVLYILYPDFNVMFQVYKVNSVVFHSLK